MFSPPEWTLRAACKDLEPEEADRIFFNYYSHRKARELCEGCPVIRECLQRCAENQDSWAWGAWAGLTADQRKRYMVDGRPDVGAALAGSASSS